MAKETTPSQYLTTAQVAGIFRVPNRVVRKWCRVGLIWATRVGQRGPWRILRSQFSVGPEEVQRLLDTVARINSRFEDDLDEDEIAPRA